MKKQWKKLTAQETWMMEISRRQRDDIQRTGRRIRRLNDTEQMKE